MLTNVQLLIERDGLATQVLGENRKDIEVNKNMLAIYEKYKHLDAIFSDPAWAEGNTKFKILMEFWAVIKEGKETKNPQNQDLEVLISNAMTQAYNDALNSLERYRFLSFGFWADQWTMLNGLLPEPRPNPFDNIVKYAIGRAWLEEKECTH